MDTVRTRDELLAYLIPNNQEVPKATALLAQAARDLIISLSQVSTNTRVVDGVQYPMTAAGINLALLDASLAGSGDVLLLPGVYPISVPIIHTYSGVRLIGAGAGWTMNGPTNGDPLTATYVTILQWTGGNVGVGTYMYEFGASSTAFYHVFSSAVIGVHLNGNHNSVSGMRARSIVNCEIDITSADYLGAYCLNWDVAASITIGGKDYSGNQYNHIKGSLQNGGYNGSAFMRGGGMRSLSDLGICSLNTFEMNIGHAYDYNGVLWRNCDGNKFDNLTIARQPNVGLTFTGAGSPDCLLTAHGFVAGDTVTFGNSQADTLPVAIEHGRPYYVLAAGLTANVFRVSLTAGGAAINMATTGSGLHEVGKPGFFMQGILSGGNYFANENQFVGAASFGVGQLVIDNGGYQGANRISHPDHYNAGPTQHWIRDAAGLGSPGVLVTPPTGEIVQAYRSGANQAIPTGGATIVFPTEVVDNNFYYDPITGVLAIPFGGWWNIRATATVTTDPGDAGKSFQLRWYSGSTILMLSDLYMQEDGVAKAQLLSMSGPVYLPAGNHGVYFYHDAGANRNINDTPSGSGSGCQLTAVNISRD